MYNTKLYSLCTYCVILSCTYQCFHRDWHLFIPTQEEGENEGELRYAPLQEHDHDLFFSYNSMKYSEQIWCSHMVLTENYTGSMQEDILHNNIIDYYYLCSCFSLYP